MGKVKFHNADRTPLINGRKGIKEFIEELIVAEKKELTALHYIFCSDQYLLKLNNEYLNHDTYTDIVTFNLSDSTAVTGEIYISIDRVRENALNYSLSFKEELLRVLFHGALHLCGFNDKKKSEITIMRSKEDEYLLLFEKK